MSTPYTAIPNTFRQRLLARERLIGCWTSLASHISTEVLGVAGFDWLLLDAEHAPNDVITLIPQMMALKDSVSAPIIRPPWNDAVIIKRLLDSGASNLLIPFVESAEEARAAVAATRYPPQGMRGVSVSHRGNRFGATTGYLKTANDHIGLLVQIESRAGVEAAAEIAAIDGVDCLFIGPSDLAAAYGQLGVAGHPEVQAAIKTIHDAAQSAGKPTGILAPAEADARRYLDMGITFVGVGSDLGLLRMASQALRDKYQDGSKESIAAQY